MINENIELSCDPLTFYSKNDKEALFEWISKIACIENSAEIGQNLCLHFRSSFLDENNVRELLSLFYRYSINRHALKIFFEEEYQDWLESTQAPPSFHSVYPHNAELKIRSKNVLIAPKVIFYSSNDKAAFWEWIEKMHCIEQVSGQLDKLYFQLNNTILSDEKLQELIALFYRYNIEMSQLKIFLNDNNKHWFANPQM